MGGLFGGAPSVKAPPPPPAPTPVPTIDNARDRQKSQDEIAMRRGRAATILTSSQGDLSTANVGTKTLLGG